MQQSESYKIKHEIIAFLKMWTMQLFMKLLVYVGSVGVKITVT